MTNNPNTPSPFDFAAQAQYLSAQIEQWQEKEAQHKYDPAIWLQCQYHITRLQATLDTVQRFARADAIMQDFRQVPITGGALVMAAFVGARLTKFKELGMIFFQQ